MNYKMRKRYTEGDIYNISFWGGIAWMFFIASFVYLGGFIITMAINHPKLAKDIIAMVTENKQSVGAMASIFLIELTSKIMAIIVLAYVFRKAMIRDLVDFKNKFWKYIAIIVLAMILSLVLSLGVAKIYEAIGIEGQSENQSIIEQALSTAIMPIGFITVVFLAPILEELIFRKALFGVVEKKYNWSKLTAVIISTIVFSAIHVMSLDNLKYIFQYIPLSFVISYAYAYTENIYIPISIHFLNNLLSFIYIIGSLNV